MNDILFVGPNGPISSFSQIAIFAEIGHYIAEHHIKSFEVPFCLFLNKTTKKTLLVADSSFKIQGSKFLVETYTNLGSASTEDYAELLSGRLRFLLDKKDSKKLSVCAYQDHGSVNYDPHEDDIREKLKLINSDNGFILESVAFSYAENMG